jgi:cytochrome c2
VYEERIEIGERVRDILQLGDGRIALWTDAARLFLLSPEPVNAAVARLTDTMPSDLHAVIKDCAQCHDLDAPSGARIGLWGVHGRTFAAGDRKLFSEAMLARLGVWDDEALHAYLENPARAVPGTTMQHPGNGDEETRRAVIDFLRELR